MGRPHKLGFGVKGLRIRVGLYVKVSLGTAVSCLHFRERCVTFPCAFVLTEAPCWLTGGQSTRDVQCMQSGGQAASASSCNSPPPSSSVSCNAQACSFCQENLCSGQGACTSEACHCSPGYLGTYCEVCCCNIQRKVKLSASALTRTCSRTKLSVAWR